MYRLALDELAAGPEALQAPTNVWVVAHTLLSLEAAARRDTETMALCRAVLEPYAQLVAYFSPMWASPVAIRRALGVMAAAEEKWDEAVGHLEQAVSFCQEKGLVVELAHARLALSDACKGRNGPGDQRRAATLADEALADYRRLGMPLYVQDALARRELLGA